MRTSLYKTKIEQKYYVVSSFTPALCLLLYARLPVDVPGPSQTQHEKTKPQHQPVLSSFAQTKRINWNTAGDGGSG